MFSRTNIELRHALVQAATAVMTHHESDELSLSVPTPDGRLITIEVKVQDRPPTGCLEVLPELPKLP